MICSKSPSVLPIVVGALLMNGRTCAMDHDGHSTIVPSSNELLRTSRTNDEISAPPHTTQSTMVSLTQRERCMEYGTVSPPWHKHRRSFYWSLFITNVFHYPISPCSLDFLSLRDLICDKIKPDSFNLHFWRLFIAPSNFGLDHKRILNHT